MTSVSRRWLRLLQLGSIVIAILLFAHFFALRGAAANPEGNTHETNQIDSRQRMITIEADGKRTPCFISGAVTVGEQLDKLGLGLEQMDTVTPSEDTLLREGDVVKVTRNRIERIEQQGVIPYETVYSYSPEVLAGTETVFVQGEDGYGTRVYEVHLANGVETKRTLVEERLDKQPVTKEVGTGFRSPLISPLNFEWDFNENGEPLNTVNVLRGQRSSAYSAPSGARTASGRDAVVGHVAVNPNVIPYGSKLFIQSSDGKYIYGYAIAADTGTALLDGRVAVDIFYNTMQECMSHGIKEVDIFVLENA